ncbi:solute carrier organic anion transporter family member 4A1 [Aplysia californica]|uniref:Solute carrier organic anion transporter family member n=1 Tax=Aplysia californica TaxID=6500 RepID=A0ABM1AB90_APLCA|nr:solute carrier organic anion transporter family member 4A1 [Aplysia californica]
MTTSKYAEKSTESDPSTSKTVVEEKEGEYGCVGLRPRPVQCMNNVKAYVFWLCVFNFWEGFIVNGVINVVLSALETRYSLSSTKSGLIASANDFGAFVFLLLVGYFGEKRHKPRLMAMGILVMSLGSLVFTLPHILGGSYKVKAIGEDNSTSSLCLIGEELSGCGQSSKNSDAHLYPLFLIGQILLGIGAAPLFTIGLTYIDENTETKMTSLYTGMTSCSAAVGVAIGYVVGGQTLDLFVDIGDGSTGSGLTPDSPQWVGAWWIGSAISCATLALVALPIVGYPRRLPGYNKLLKTRTSEAHNDGSEAVAGKPDFGKTVKDFPKACFLVLKNPTFLLTCLGGVGDALIVGGTASFGAKLLQVLFHVDLSTAGWIMGAITVPGSGGGMILGGYLVKRLKLKCRGILRLCALFVGLSLLFSPSWLAHCDDANIAGIQAPYEKQGDARGGLTASCNANCSCGTGTLEPLCTDSGLVYFSPCHAGCTGYNSSSKMYTDCLCFQHLGDGQFGNSSTEVTTRPGDCTSTCPWLYVFCALFFFIMLFTFATISPNITAVFRCVPYSQRSLAIGFELLFIRLLGTTPGPILFGYVIDSACDVWEDNCGSRGSCWVYRSSDMGLRILVWWITLKAMGMIFYILASVVYKPPAKEDKDDDTFATIGKDNLAYISGDLEPNPAHNGSSQPHGNTPQHQEAGQTSFSSVSVNGGGDSNKDALPGNTTTTASQNANPNLEKHVESAVMTHL